MGRLRRDERGQTMVMAVTVIFALSIMVAVVADIGQVVNRKVALQLVADAGAFTGASKMAEGMNYLAYGNRMLQYVYAGWETAFVLAAIFSLDECGPMDTATRFAKYVYDPLDWSISFFNYWYPSFPYVEARRASLANVRELFPGESGFQFAETPLKDAGQAAVGLLRNYLPAGLANYLNAPSGAAAASDAGMLWPFITFNLNQWRLTARPFFRLTDLETVPTWTMSSVVPPAFAMPEYVPCKVTTPLWIFWPLPADTLHPWYKKSEGVDHFVWHVKAPPTKALFFDQLLGGNAIPAMRAVAAAKPVGGTIERGETTYVAKMVVVRKVTWSGGWIYDPQITDVLSRFRRIWH